MKVSDSSSPIFFCAQQRSGTTVLQRTIRQSPLVDNYGEVFHHQLTKEYSFFEFKDELLKEQPELWLPSPENQEVVFETYIKHLENLTSKRYFVVDVKYNSWHHFNTFWQHIVEEPFLLKMMMARKYKIIHIVRKNVFNQYVSSKFAQLHQKYHYNEREASKVKEKEKIRINVRDCQKRMAFSVSQSALFHRWLKKYPFYLRIFYEDMFVDGQFSEDVLASINQLIGENLEFPLQPALKKIPRDLNTLIINKAQVKKCFSDTRFEKFVEEAFG